MAMAIFTKYLGYTNTKSSRVKAYAAHYGNERVDSVTINYDHALDAYGNHEAAAHALASKIGWHGRYVAADAGKGLTVFVRDTGNAPSFLVEKA